MRAQPRRDAVLAGVLATAAVVAALALDPTGSVDLFRARAFDTMLDATAPRGPAPRIVVIDIDAASLDRVGPWPWRRENIAAVIDAARAAGAAAIGVDILFAAPETQSPAALARRLAAETGDARRARPRGLLDRRRRAARAIAYGGPRRSGVRALVRPRGAGAGERPDPGARSARPRRDLERRRRLSHAEARGERHARRAVACGRRRRDRAPRAAAGCDRRGFAAGTGP